MTRLAEMFNVNHFIVSQVNPHVVPFLVNEETVNGDGILENPGSAASGSGWLNTLASFAKSEALHRMHVLSELGVFPNYFTKLRSVLSQKYSGDITILPEISYTQFPRVLKNPTIDFMLNAMRCGERATWPKLSRIQNHCAIELALDNAVQKLRTKIAFSPSQVDLRMISLGTVTKMDRQETGFPLIQRRGRLTGRNRTKTKSWCADAKSFPQHSSLCASSSSQSRFSVPPAPFELPSIGAKLADAETVVPADSGSDSDEEDNGGPYLRCMGRRGKNTTAKRRVAIQSEDVDPNFTATTIYDSSISNPRSYSPSSEARSPPEYDTTLMSRSTPALWPAATRPYIASMPTTPFVTTETRHRERDEDVNEKFVETDQFDSPTMLELTKSMPEEAFDRERKNRSVIGADFEQGLLLDISETRGMILRKKAMGGC
jgi:hypothetical protein